MKKQRVAENSTIVAVPDQVSCELDGEAVILHLDNGIYYGLNPIGAHIWELIQQPVRVSELVATLTQEYDVEPARCEDDVISLLAELSSNQLIEVSNGNGVSG